MPLAKNELRDRPAREPLTSLGAIVRDWQWRFPVDRRDMVVEFCREAPALNVAVMRAVRSRNAEGKMHNHQSRVKEADRDLFGRRILLNLVGILADVRTSDPDDKFDKLHDWCEHLAPKGIGPVTIYDVATRIGAHPSMDAEPSSLYLHAGCRLGWNALTQDRARWAKVERVKRAQLPVELQQIPADQVEDLCCTYRLVFDELEDRGTWPN